MLTLPMSDSPAQGSYFYPNTSDDPDRTDVLRNKFGIETHSELRIEEYRATAFRMAEIAEGDGPQGQFDKAHLKAIHGHIFQDVYEWAGHTRDESPIVDGQRVEPIGGLSKGGTAFLHGSRIEMGLDEALKAIRDPEVLRGSTPEQFAERAGQVMAELNYVHPFREGNGRTQEVFIAELGRPYGHEVDFTVITKPRIVEASIETTNDPSSAAMKHVLEDAVDPNRREAFAPHFPISRRAARYRLNTTSAQPAQAKKLPARCSGTTTVSPASSRTNGSSPSIAQTSLSDCPLMRRKSPLPPDPTFPTLAVSHRPSRRPCRPKAPKRPGKTRRLPS